MAREVLESRIRRELPHIPEGDARELARVVERVVDALEPEQVYLFGSQARGDVTRDSDFDLLVVVTSSDLPGHRLDQEAYGAIGLHDISLDILTITRGEFERRRRAQTSLPATVLREGRLLYAA